MFHVLVGAAMIATTLLPGRLFAQDYQSFFGLLHGHTHFSDGRGTPAEAFQAARDAGLDFFAVTEHNHSQAGGPDGVPLNDTRYAQLILAAQNATDEGSFVSLYGQEVSSISKGNHVNIFNANEIVDVANGDFETLYEEWMEDHPEARLLQFNHPNFRQDQDPLTASSKRDNDYGIDDYEGDFAALVEAAGLRTALIEMIIGPAFNDRTDEQHHDGRHEEDYRFYLNQGFRLAPSVGQDNHFQNWGESTHARLAVWAEELTEDGIYKGSARSAYLRYGGQEHPRLPEGE